MLVVRTALRHWPPAARASFNKATDLLVDGGLIAAMSD
jgi:hypothetical protein